MAKVLDRDAILAAADRPVEAVEVPEWGGAVQIRAMDALTWGRLALQLDGKDDAQIRVLMCAACLVDEAGGRLFDPGSAEDVALLAGRSFNAIRRISDRAIEISRATAGDVEAFQENFPETPGDDLPSG